MMESGAVGWTGPPLRESHDGARDRMSKCRMGPGAEFASATGSLFPQVAHGLSTLRRMDRILTLLLAFLIAFAPAVSGEGGIGHSAVVLETGNSRQGGHLHRTGLDAPQHADRYSSQCSLVIGHCAVALQSFPGDVCMADFSAAARLTAHPQELGRGIVLTSDPPPPRG